MRIQHNRLAANACRNYSTNTSAVSKNLEKLASGYRINRAADDAAGLAISEKMRCQITGLGRAQRNVKEGISLIKTAEGGIQEIHDMLNRMVGLATQSANGTYEDTVDRASLQRELEQLNSEIDRIARSTNFNGIPLLDGSLADEEPVGTDRPNDPDSKPVDPSTPVDPPDPGPGSTQLSVNMGSVGFRNQTGEILEITVGSGKITIAADGTGQPLNGAQIVSKIAAAAQGTGSGVTFSGDFQLSGGKLTFGGDEMTITGSGSSITFTGQIDKDEDVIVNGSGAIKAGTAETENTYSETLASNNKSTQWAATGCDLNSGLVTSATIKALGYVNAYFFTPTVPSDLDIMFNLVDKGAWFNNCQTVLDVTREVTRVCNLVLEQHVKDMEAQGKDQFYRYEVTLVKGGYDSLTTNYRVYSRTKTTAVKPGSGESIDGLKLNGGGATPPVDPDPPGGDPGNIPEDNSQPERGLILQIGEGSDSWDRLAVKIGSMRTAALGIGRLDIGSQPGAQQAVGTVREAINRVSKVRSYLGATQNRLDATYNSLSVMSENIQSAESLIRDTDIAEVMMQYTKNSILTQSAQAMLAQANQVPQGVLQLLG